MPTVAETAGAPHQLAAGLALGVDTLSENQTVHFDLYVRQVLPADGFIFWVKAAILVSPPAGPLTLDAPGSMHYASATDQNESESGTVNSMVFTARQLIQDFTDVAPGQMWVGTFEGTRFAFGDRGMFYQQAQTYHYRGRALMSFQDTQLIDDLNDLNLTDPVVSNSLPLWLTLNRFFTVYPSYLVPQNAQPPYASAHVHPESTEALAMAPTLELNSSHYQLTRDRVTLTLYGVRNAMALDFQDYVFQQSLDTDAFGLMSMPIMRDGKVTQREMGIIAQEKTMVLEISYYQSRIQALSRQFILHAVCALTVVQ